MIKQKKVSTWEGKYGRDLKGNSWEGLQGAESGESDVILVQLKPY